MYGVEDDCPEGRLDRHPPYQLLYKETAPRSGAPREGQRSVVQLKDKSYLSDPSCEKRRVEVAVESSLCSTEVQRQTQETTLLKCPCK